MDSLKNSVFSICFQTSYFFLGLVFFPGLLVGFSILDLRETTNQRGFILHPTQTNAQNLGRLGSKPRYSGSLVLHQSCKIVTQLQSLTVAFGAEL